MKSTVGKIGIFLLVISGVIGYLKTGANLFENIRNGTINLELKSIDRALVGTKTLNGKYPKNFKKFMTESFETKSNKKVGTDPWGQYYQYKITKTGYWLASSGPNELMGDKDDISAERVGENYTITTGAVEKSQQVQPTQHGQEQKEQANDEPSINEILAYIDIKNLERPFDDFTDKDIAQMIETLLESYQIE